MILMSEVPLYPLSPLSIMCAGVQKEFCDEFHLLDLRSLDACLKVPALCTLHPTPPQSPNQTARLLVNR